MGDGEDTSPFPTQWRHATGSRSNPRGTRSTPFHDVTLALRGRNSQTLYSSYDALGAQGQGKGIGSLDEARGNLRARALPMLLTHDSS